MVHVPASRIPTLTGFSSHDVPPPMAASLQKYSQKSSSDKAGSMQGAPGKMDKYSQKSISEPVFCMQVAGKIQNNL